MQIIRTHRKTIALIITPGGDLIVRAPLHTGVSIIEDFVRQKAGWIERHQRRYREHAASRPAPTYSNGECFFYRGENYPLELVERSRPLLDLTDGHFRLSAAAKPRAVEVFQHWYRARALEIIPARVAELAAQCGFPYNRVRITSARTRWGSCSRRGALAFSWRLMLVPPDVLDYVIIHELAHLVELNHSQKFWDLVERLLPGFRAQRTWLKEARFNI